MKIYYSPDYVGSAVTFETTRKAQWIAESLGRAPIGAIDLVSPEPLTPEQLTQVHDPEYVQAVRTGAPRVLAESQGFAWDEGLWRMALASNGGAIAAGLAALEDGIAGSLSSGLHHARRDRGAGFCTFNGLVLAAKEAIAAGASSVLILDLDAHCGGGTASLIANEEPIWQLDVSVTAFDRYPPGARAHLFMVRNPCEYLSEVQRRLDEIGRRAPHFELCLYNAGMDPFEDCPIGGLAGMTREILAARERLVFEWCRAAKLPIAFVMAGGYLGPRLEVEGLVGLHRLTLSAASSSVRPR
jgi:acetoin utilization deacetylase AcuC-like enzyme